MRSKLFPIVFSLLFLEFAVGCGDGAPDPEYTWGESVMEVSDAFCEAKQRCDYTARYSDKQVEKCKVESYALCEPYNNCDVDIGDEAREPTAACVASLEALMDPGGDPCFLFFAFNQLPQECLDWFKLEPDPATK